jgi:hypothetical protein
MECYNLSAKPLWAYIDDADGLKTTSNTFFFASITVNVYVHNAAYVV